MRRRLLVVVVALVGLGLTLGAGRAATAGQATPAEAGASPTACPTTTEDENVAIARVWHEEAINNRNLAALADVLHPDVVHHSAGGYPDVATAADVGAMMDDFPAAFSDIEYTFDQFIAQDDLVVERYTATGTQDGPFQGQPPSGRRATWTGINIFRIECGLIVEIWSEVDALGRNQQLFGPPPATPTP